MKAVKDNKEYDITENQKAEYLAQGYDIVQDGKVIEYSPKKTISYSEYQKVKKELEEAKENNTNVELTKTNADLTKQVEDLTKTNADLTKQVEDLTKTNADLTKQVEKLTKQLEKAN